MNPVAPVTTTFTRASDQAPRAAPDLEQVAQLGVEVALGQAGRELQRLADRELRRDRRRQHAAGPVQRAERQALPVEEDLVLAVEQEVDGALGGEVPALHQRSEEHTSELQSQSNLVCRLLLEKKKKTA